MAEKSFKKEVETLRKGAGEVFHGEGILAVTKALLECGVGYVGGYQGSPISHLMDVFADAEPLLEELGVYFENSASEAAAAAMLSASVYYPIRGAVTWKSTVGTNVASDALSNLASGGVTGGTLVIVGEDYGEGSSIMQERTHAFAMKSQIWLLDPRPNLESIVKSVELGFELSEASNSPVILQLRVRSCHLHGQFIARDNQPPKVKISDCLNDPKRDVSRIVLPPATFLHEKEKVEKRLPKAIQFIKDQQINEFLKGDREDIGIIVQGGLFNNLNRALVSLGLSDNLGNVKIPVYVMNVAYPVIPDEVVDFCRDKKSVLMIEEAQPNYIEQNIGYLLHKHHLTTKLYGKNVLPEVGDYTIGVVKEGLVKYFEDIGEELTTAQREVFTKKISEEDNKQLLEKVPVRPAGFCTGCPERPIFAALKIVQERIGQHHIAGDIGCHLFSILPPFNIGATTMGYGLGASSAAAFNLFNTPTQEGQKRPIAIMGDGGFWHNGLTSGIGNAVYNKFDGLIIIIDNYYAAATGGQDIPSSRAYNFLRTTNNPIEKAVKGVGVQYVKIIDRTYDVERMVKELTRALTTKEKGPKVIIAQSECSLNKERRKKRIFKKRVEEGKRVENEKFGVDAKVCTGDHACMRLSGCPSLTLKYTDNPLREDPVAHIEQSCVACGNCGEVAEAAALCPAFYSAKVIRNAGFMEKLIYKIQYGMISFLQKRRASKQIIT
ncbi:indolepyruvate ferredoxin oxidoreductase subunit alpha [Sphingobacterium lactis]|uniref:Indolepyruvate ferredoxin oxidoreductase alpha subunit n=1 Tax=Sphingobacterium lactis TaxID=797291 RepID=A0A1H5SQY8_9SPHI|nr:indolepyruvate ferredoxin oxidoreductase subunit alpha [Sphingobacterium lactis]SEF52251.1 indolepyruvate ferredoxin oxidoreductase alpha subunit [Sphingobacterium lactis]